MRLPDHVVLLCRRSQNGKGRVGSSYSLSPVNRDSGASLAIPPPIYSHQHHNTFPHPLITSPILSNISGSPIRFVDSYKGTHWFPVLIYHTLIRSFPLFSFRFWYRKAFVGRSDCLFGWVILWSHYAGIVMSRNDNVPVMVEEHSPPCRQFVVEYDLVVFQDCLRRCQCLYRVLAPYVFIVL